MVKKQFTKLLIIVFFILFIFISVHKLNVSKGATSTLNNRLIIHFIDVGQGDSVLIQINDKTLLVDSGPDKKAFSYLKKLGVKKLDYVICTHPHDDHLGGMPYIIKNIPIGTFYSPKITNTTESFKNMIQSLHSKNLKIIPASAGIQLNLEKNVNIIMFSPNNNYYKELNNYSIVFKLTYLNTSFLFTGDAEIVNEEEMLNNGYNLASNVIKIGHHGSISSSSKNFLKEVNPSIAVISCGKGNDYGHPHKDTLLKLKEQDISIFRTDIDGTTILESDGYKIMKRK